jgi:hypothetical protein
MLNSEQEVQEDQGPHDLFVVQCKRKQVQPHQGMSIYLQLFKKILRGNISVCKNRIWEMQNGFVPCKSADIHNSRTYA